MMMKLKMASRKPTCDPSSNPTARDATAASAVSFSTQSKKKTWPACSRAGRTGIIPNRKGHPLIQRWYGVRFLGGKLKETLNLEETLKRTRFSEDHPNPAHPIDFAAVEKLFPETVECLAIHLSEARDSFRRDTQPELESQLAKLRAFLDSRTTQLELDFVESISKGLASTHDYKRQKKEADQRAIQKKHDDYKTWITETMETEDSPSIRLFAVFGNFDS